MSGYVTSGNNRLLSDGTYTYEYDAEGHRTRQTDIATGVVVEYTWDYRSRLTQLTFKDANGSETKLVRYTYDAFDRRIRKEVDADGNATYESSESYVYDGSNIVLVADETGSLTNRYLHGPAVDQILADEQISSSSQTPNEVLWALTDNQGSVRDFVIRDATTGQTLIVDHLVYDAYGQIVAHTNPQQGGIASTRDIHYAYTGREWDSDAGQTALGGLYFYRARWYDAQAGRFISEDPLGFAAGDTNVQRYVGNSATNLRDPSGMDPGLAFDPYAARGGSTGSGETWNWGQGFAEYWSYLTWSGPPPVDTLDSVLANTQATATVTGPGAIVIAGTIVAAPVVVPAVSSMSMYAGTSVTATSVGMWAAQNPDISTQMVYNFAEGMHYSQASDPIDVFLDGTQYAGWTGFGMVFFAEKLGTHVTFPNNQPVDKYGNYFPTAVVYSGVPVQLGNHKKLLSNLQVATPQANRHLR